MEKKYIQPTTPPYLVRTVEFHDGRVFVFGAVGHDALPAVDVESPHGGPELSGQSRQKRGPGLVVMSEVELGLF